MTLMRKQLWVTLLAVLLGLTCFGVTPSWARSYTMRHAATHITAKSSSDQRIQSAVKHKLWEADALEGTYIDVSVRRGQVTLKGDVTTNEQKVSASALVHSVSGVNAVQNGLKVTSTDQVGARPIFHKKTVQDLNDIRITSAVRSGLRDKAYKNTDITVRTFAGEVVLSGTVDTPDQADLATTMAGKKPGVVKVINRLKSVQSG